MIGGHPPPAPFQPPVQTRKHSCWGSPTLLLLLVPPLQDDHGITQDDAATLERAADALEELAGVARGGSDVQSRRQEPENDGRAAQTGLLQAAPAQQQGELVPADPAAAATGQQPKLKKKRKGDAAAADAATEAYGHGDKKKKHKVKA